MKKIILYSLLTLSIAFNILLSKDRITHVYKKRVMPLISTQYKADKKLIEPYFDEEFYRKNYARALHETNLKPIDHFMQHGWKGDYKQHCDPNDWFNVTLYKDRLWPCKGNPFVDFLHQPAHTIKVDAKNAEIFVKNESEVYRAWIAAEAFLRQNKHNVHIVLSSISFKTIPTCFKPMMARGLKVILKDGDIPSFYRSPFLKSPADFDVTMSYEKKKFMPMDIKGQEFHYIWHALYSYNNYPTEGRVNPLMLNFANYTDEPLFTCPYGHTSSEYQAYMKRIASGYDLFFTGIKIDTPNERIIPGFMCTFLDESEIKEIAPEKTFSVSFLLSFGGAGNKAYHSKTTENYYMRELLWQNKDAIKTPKEFYVSKSDIANYTAEYQPHVMPTRSKKWIFGSQFNIAIENCKQTNYFTEKIIGCFASMVIPIYIGCPNITDYFDERGMFIAKDIDDVIRICNSLTPETYKKMLPYLIENKKRAEALLVLKNKQIQEFYESHMK